ncbi:hypothetical protein K1T35_11565 [Pseudonocardia sp. DSM 110487]|uniref:hypothetical protein n=1 Tax=Pseudonocardia sp. DSM 110487 TaxID=2865833 RepID=UPI001C69EB2A|nr:hypothetical protein [Pseudonocardia sp. DSM 110487]QYN37816.1 hypothetical protein K1T35_11565 [Pseudonocardia sp. DSM 110487]
MNYSAYATLVTSQFGERAAHQVLDWHAGDRTGLLRTVCGRLIVPAPMVAPIGTPCTACTALAPGRPPARGRGRRWRILRRG